MSHSHTVPQASSHRAKSPIPKPEAKPSIWEGKKTKIEEAKKIWLQESTPENLNKLQVAISEAESFSNRWFNEFEMKFGNNTKKKPIKYLEAVGTDNYPTRARYITHVKDYIKAIQEKKANQAQSAIPDPKAPEVYFKTNWKDVKATVKEKKLQFEKQWQEAPHDTPEIKPWDEALKQLEQEDAQLVRYEALEKKEEQFVDQQSHLLSKGLHFINAVSHIGEDNAEKRQKTLNKHRNAIEYYHWESLQRNIHRSKHKYETEDKETQSANMKVWGNDVEKLKHYYETKKASHDKNFIGNEKIHQPDMAVLKYEEEYHVAKKAYDDAHSVVATVAAAVAPVMSYLTHSESTNPTVKKRSRFSFFCCCDKSADSDDYQLMREDKASARPN